VLIFKSVSSNTVAVGSEVDVTITLANNGTEDAHNVRSFDYMTENFTVKSGSQNATYELLGGGENVSYTYTMTPLTPGLYSASAVVVYDDRDGFQYDRTSDPAAITAVKTSTQSLSSSPTLILAAIAAIVVILLVAYIMVTR
jgi:uncharacterized repeat protein (TIGR01451 family)